MGEGGVSDSCMLSWLSDLYNVLVFFIPGRRNIDVNIKLPNLIPPKFIPNDNTKGKFVLFKFSAC